MNKLGFFTVLGMGIMMLFLGWPVSGNAAGVTIPDGVTVDLDAEFYKVLKEESEANQSRQRTRHPTMKDREVDQEGYYLGTRKSSKEDDGKADQAGHLSSRTSDKEYLRQIAVSTRYMVESNLKIIKQQERMIKLLEKMSKK